MSGGVWWVHPSTGAVERERLARGGARVVESWWVRSPYWTASEVVA